MKITDPDSAFQQSSTPRYLYVVPYSTAVLGLEILTLLVCWKFIGIGMILEIITLVLANQGQGKYKAQPSVYRKASYNRLKTGMICAFIGIGLSILSIIFMLIRRLLVGVFFSLFSGYDFISNLFPKW